MRPLPVAFVMMLAAVPASGAADRVTALLARSTTPGSLVLLVQDGRDPRVTTRWIESLMAPDAQVRLLAARLLRQTHPATAADPLRKALATETDHFVAAEQARSLLEIAPDAEAPVIEAAARLKDEGLAAILGRLRGPRALGAFDRVRDQCGSAAAAVLIGAIVEGSPDILNALPAHVVEDDAALKAAFVSAIVIRIAPHGPWLGSVLTQRSSDVRMLAWWSIAVSSDGASSAEDVKAASTSRGSSPDGPALRLGRALALRAAGQTSDEDIVQLTAQVVKDTELPASARAALVDGAVTQLLTDREKENMPPALQKPGPPLPTTSAAVSKYNAMRTVDTLPRGLISDVMAVSGCKAKPRDAVAGALVKYGATGQPVQMGLLTSELSQPCQDAAQALMLTSLLGEEGAAAANAMHVVLIPLDQDFDQCLDPLKSGGSDGAAHEGTAPVRIGGEIVPPKKTKDVHPVYPKPAMDRHVTGVVILDAVVSSRGCVNRATVLRTLDPMLDEEAVRAVIQWKFTPTLSGGVPVPVLMTVTVQFTLQ